MTPVTGIALSGIVAATTALNASASNLANANDTAKVGGKPAYNRVAVQNTAAAGGGVVANVQGLVQQPEISPVTEITNQLTAGRAFAFSLEALKAADEEQKTLLDIKT